MGTQAALSNNIPEFDNWQDMLKETPDLDGIVISTPNFLHTGPAVTCLEMGLPIALEKPLATTQQDCERILSAKQATADESF